MSTQRPSGVSSGRESQLDLLPAAHEAAFYHDVGRFGYFALLVDDDGKRRQNSYPLSEMPTVLGLIDPRRDSWLSQAEFTQPCRRVVHLARLGLLFVDVDTYRSDQAWMGANPEKAAEALLEHCYQQHLPAPSLIVFSGQGFQLKWILERPIPRQALPRWNSCQRQLVDAFKGFGADPRAKDASRVLRVIRTVNSKTGQLCRVVWQSDQAYGFEELAEWLLPLSREQLEAQRAARRNRRQLQLLEGGRSSNLKAFSGRRLAWDRLEDLRRLVQLRGGVPVGERMNTLFWHLNFLLLSGATTAGQMWHEAAALAREIDPAWGYRAGELGTLYRKAQAFARGEKVEFGGRQHPALYTPKNQTLIDLFEISDDEQRLLKTIISADMALERRRARDRERDEERRREAGAVEREAYEGAAKAKAARALELREQGLSVRKIAAEMGVSVGSVSGYLKTGVQSPSPITNGEASAAR